MFRTVQAVDFGLLPPYPIALHPRVSAFVGQNGSGKSTALDCLRAVLGVNRFGQGRSCAQYLNTGRGVHPPAREAFVLACAQAPADRVTQLSFCAPEGAFTLCLWITRSRRLFLALPGHLLLGLDGTSLQDDLAAFKERYPRNVWLRADEYQQRVLNPLGATASVQRLLELPQGESQRLLEARPDRLLRDLLGLMGALDPLEQLAERRSDYAEAQREREKARQAVLEEELALTQAQRDLKPTGRLDAAREQLDAVDARVRGAAAALTAALDAEEHALQTERDQAAAEIDDARAELARARDAARRTATAPDEFAAAVACQQQLGDDGIRCQVIAAALTARNASSEQVSAMRADLCAVAVCTEDWNRVAARVGEFPQVRFVRGAAAKTPGAAWWKANAPAAGALRDTGSHVGVDDRAFVPRLDVELPLEPDASDRVEDARARVWELERAVADADRRLEQVSARRDDPQRALALVGEGDVAAAQAEDLSGLLSERRRLQTHAAELEADEERQADRARKLERQAERLKDAQTFLDGQEGALEQARDALEEARSLYQAHVRRLVASLGAHFSELCDAALMRGEIELIDDPLAEAGGRLNIRVAETPNAPLRAYHGEAEMSGGWRAKTAVLVLLAAMCAGGGDRTLPVALLDEHSAALDEERVNEIGWVLQRLAREMNLQVICAMPTKRTSESISWCDLQAGFLKAHPDAMYSPLPHLLEAADEATVPPPV